jgi:succinyl-diaminopimelate desuccinylase
MTSRPDPSSANADSRAVGIARDLLRVPSLTPAGPEAFDVVEGLLAAAGFTVRRRVFAEPCTADAINLWAEIGAGHPHLAFNGHLDVVPPGPEARWRHGPFSGDLAGGELWGRGAVDMKGGVAAFLAAVLDRLDARAGDTGGHISILITGDEEGPAVNGTRKLVRWCAEEGASFDAAIVGEPTSVARLGDTVKIGRRGSLSGTVTVSGVQGHVAYPERSANPVPPLVAVAAALSSPPLDAGTAHFAPSNLEIVSVDVGNPSWNVIPGEARLRFNVRYNDTFSRDSLPAELARRVAAVPLPPGVTARLAIEPGYGDVFLTRPGPLVDCLSAAIADVTGLTPELGTGGGTSDARFLKDHCPVVEFGPVGTTMHQLDERVPVAELAALAAIYGRFLDRFFGDAGPGAR